MPFLTADIGIACFSAADPEPDCSLTATRRNLAATGRNWLNLAATWLQLAEPGRNWPQLAATWLQLAATGRNWLQLAAFGDRAA